MALLHLGGDLPDALTEAVALQAACIFRFSEMRSDDAALLSS